MQAISKETITSGHQPITEDAATHIAESLNARQREKKINDRLQDFANSPDLFGKFIARAFSEPIMGARRFKDTAVEALRQDILQDNWSWVESYPNKVDAWLNDQSQPTISIKPSGRHSSAEAEKEKEISNSTHLAEHGDVGWKEKFRAMNLRLCDGLAVTPGNLAPQLALWELVDSHKAHPNHKILSDKQEQILPSSETLSDKLHNNTQFFEQLHPQIPEFELEYSLPQKDQLKLPTLNACDAMQQTSNNGAQLSNKLAFIAQVAETFGLPVYAEDGTLSLQTSGTKIPIVTSSYMPADNHYAEYKAQQEAIVIFDTAIQELASCREISLQAIEQLKVDPIEKEKHSRAVDFAVATTIGAILIHEGSHAKQCQNYPPEQTSNFSQIWLATAEKHAYASQTKFVEDVYNENQEQFDLVFNVLAETTKNTIIEDIIAASPLVFETQHGDNYIEDRMKVPCDIRANSDSTLAYMKANFPIPKDVQDFISAGGNPQDYPLEDLGSEYSQEVDVEDLGRVDDLDPLLAPDTVGKPRA